MYGFVTNREESRVLPPHSCRRVDAKDKPEGQMVARVHVVRQVFLLLKRHPHDGFLHEARVVAVEPGRKCF